MKSFMIIFYHNVAFILIFTLVVNLASLIYLIMEGKLDYIREFLDSKEYAIQIGIR